MPSPRAKPLLEFGAVPLTASPAAEAALLRLPRKGLRRLGDELRAWAARTPVSDAKALYYVDVDDPDLRYVLLQFLLVPPRTFDVDDQVEYEELILGDLIRVQTEVLDALSEKDGRRLSDGLTLAVPGPTTGTTPGAIPLPARPRAVPSGPRTWQTRTPAPLRPSA